MGKSMAGTVQAGEMRRFACTSCGKCCDKGPEMELGEAAALADSFILSVLFKVHSLPLDDRSDYAARWWQQQQSRIPLRPALEEQRRHLSHFASRRQNDKARGRQLLLTISAIAQDEGQGRCPALRDGLCGIYETRPLTCRTVPLHYSRTPSTLRAYLDGFTATPGYRCDSSAQAPLVLDGNRIIAAEVEQVRLAAMERAKKDRVWKDHLLAAMDDEQQARLAELPTYAAVLANTDAGYATLLPMIVAWRVAQHHGLMPRAEMEALCRGQMALIKAAIADNPAAERLRELVDLLAVYQFELSRERLAGRVLPAF
jgi:Fe-S-cluster containining protein